MTSKRTFITAHKAQYAVSILCRLLEISRGWFYGFPASQPARDQRQVNREARDQELLPKIKTFFKVSKKCYGSKRIHQDLLADSEVVSERRVARIMKENKLSPLLRKRRKPITTDSNHMLKPSIAPSHTYCVCAAGKWAGDCEAICREGPNLLEQKFHSQTPNTVCPLSDAEHRLPGNRWPTSPISTPLLGIMLRITLPGKGRGLALSGWREGHGHA
ncbi:IS3 family transposase [Octadecabacter antarcticus]|uniref:IS3 family transposase n=1 Tax=Octadecabacter antarcticus TaxID=1217908 RepID=UPI0001806980|nr:IS3 family transposase [Octadecabacter antarcticus]